MQMIQSESELSTGIPGTGLIPGWWVAFLLHTMVDRHDEGGAGDGMLGRRVYDGATRAEIIAPVNKAVGISSKTQDAGRRTQIEGRKMSLPNHFMTIRVEAHLGDDTRKGFLMEVANSVRWGVLEKAIRSRVGPQLPATHRFFWLHPNGDLLELDGSQAFGLLQLEWWCCHPWVIHAHEGGASLSALRFISHARRAKALFDR